jgi:transcriptional regulator with XRE-family HTH domain
MKKRTNQPKKHELIRAARLASGMTQGQAAARCGYSRSMWINLEMGHRTPTKRAWPAICAALNISSPAAQGGGQCLPVGGFKIAAGEGLP